jgi:hypothetical protein
VFSIGRDARIVFGARQIGLWTKVDRTTESSVAEMKLQIWNFGSLHSGTFRLANSEGTFAEPARCCMTA